MLQECLQGGEQTSFMYPSGADVFKHQFAHLEEHYGKGERSAPLQRQHASLPRERICASKIEINDQNNDFEKGTAESVARTTLQNPLKSQEEPEKILTMGDGSDKPNTSACSLLKSASTSSKCGDVKGKLDIEASGILISYLKMERKKRYQNTDVTVHKVRELGDYFAMNAN